MAAKSNVVISEGQVTFKRVEGHKHDGLTSTLIDTSKYSMFDFIATENARDTSRAARQQNNKNVLKTFIIDTIEGRVLNPEGIRIQANAISAREIIAGTITADELSSNIVLVNNIIRSNNFINNTTTQTGWAIYSNGTGIFNNIQIRGNLVAGTGVYANTNTPIFANIGGYFSLGSNFTWNGSTLTIKGDLRFPDNTSPQSQNATDGFIGGIDINASEIQSNGFSSGSAGFRISANGNAEFNNVTIRGDLDAGTVGGLVIDSGDLVAGDVVADDAYGEYVKLQATGQLLAYRKDYNFGVGEYYSKVDVMGAEPGIVITGTANGSLNSTRLLSSAIFTPTIILNGTSIATSLAGKANAHSHPYASDDHLHDSRYVNVDGDTMTGILTGTGIDMTGNLRYGGKCYSTDTSFTNFGSKGGTAAGDVMFRANTSFTLYERTLSPSGTNRAVYVNSDSTLFCGANVSSLRYKNSITDASLDSQSFLKLKIVNFYYNDDLCDLENEPEKELQIGIIAENVDELGLSDLLVYDDQGRPDVLRKEYLVFYLLKTCQDQQAEIDDLKARIQALEGV